MKRQFTCRKRAIALALCGLCLVARAAHAGEGELRLDEVIRQTLQGNPSLQASVAKWNSLKERIPQARSWDDPMAGVDFERSGSKRITRYSDAEWMVSQSIPLAGKNLSRGRAAEAEARVAQQEVRRLRLELTAKARTAYYRLANAHAQLLLNGQNRNLLVDVLALGNAKLSVGRGTQGSVLAMETDLQRLAIDRENLAQILSDQQTVLNVLMNRPPGSALGHPARLAFRPLLGDAAALEARLLAQRPEIAGAEMRLRAEEARLQLARREWIPDPQLRLEARHFRGSSETFTEYDTGIFFSVPWANPLKYAAGVRGAQRMVEATRREIQSEQNNGRGLLRDQLRRISTFRRQYELSRDRLVPLARRTTETLRVNYQADAASYVELLVAHRALREAAAMASMQLTDYLAALAELEAIVGAEPRRPEASKAPFPPSKRRQP